MITLDIYYYKLEALTNYNGEKVELYVALDLCNKSVLAIKIIPLNIATKIEAVFRTLSLKLCTSEIMEQIVVELKNGTRDH